MLIRLKDRTVDVDEASLETDELLRQARCLLCGRSTNNYEWRWRDVMHDPHVGEWRSVIVCVSCGRDGGYNYDLWLSRTNVTDGQ